MHRTLPAIAILALAALTAAVTPFPAAARDDAGVIYYERWQVDTESSSDSIRSVNADGSNDHQVDVGFHQIYLVSASSDGTKLAFGANDPTGAGHSGLYIAGSDGSNVIETGAQGWSPALSADNSRLLVTQNYDIYSMNADGSDLAPIAADPDIQDFAAWSPDGTRIAYVSLQDNEPIQGFVSSFEIYVANADGSEKQRLTNTGYNSFPDWSPDGTKIAFMSLRDGYGAIYVMNADGSDQHAVIADHWCEAPATPAPTPPATPTVCNGDDDPDWSPDGSAIAFIRQTGGALQNNVWAVNADGTNERQITQTGGASYPHWVSSSAAPAVAPEETATSTPTTEPDASPTITDRATRTPLPLEDTEDGGTSSSTPSPTTAATAAGFLVGLPILAVFAIRRLT